MVRSVLIMLLLIVSGCHFIATGEMEPVAKESVEDRAIIIATIKYFMSPEWTIEDYKKEIRYQQYLQRQK